MWMKGEEPAQPVQIHGLSRTNTTKCAFYLRCVVYYFLCTEEEEVRGGADAMPLLAGSAVKVQTSPDTTHTHSASGASQTPDVPGAAEDNAAIPVSADLCELSSDDSDEDLAAAGWQDDDPIRAKVGSLLAKYGTMEGVQATSVSKEAAKAADLERNRTERECRTPNIKDEFHWPRHVEDVPVRFRQDALPAVVFDEGEYVVIDAVDSQDASTETSVEPMSGSDGARSMSDATDESFEDVQWVDDAVIMRAEVHNKGYGVEDEADNAMLLSDLRAAVVASLATLDSEDRARISSPPPHTFLAGAILPTHHLPDSSTPNGNARSPDDLTFSSEVQSFSDENVFGRFGRYPRMFPLQDDDCSDSLSIITERTEPDNDSGLLSSQSSTPTDSIRSHSRSSTPVQRPRSSTPSTIEELDTEDEILTQPSTVQRFLLTSPDEEDTHEEGSHTSGSVVLRADSLGSDHSASECSATESAQDGHQVRAIEDRRDSFDILVDSSINVSVSVDFTEVYEVNRQFVDDVDLEVTGSVLDSGQGKMDERLCHSDFETGSAAKELDLTTGDKLLSAENRSGENKQNSILRKKKANRSTTETKRKKVEDTANMNPDAAQSYKDARKSLLHVERTENTEVSEEKRRKMSDDVVVDKSHLSSLDELTKMFDVGPGYLRSSPRPNKKQISTASLPPDRVENASPWFSTVPIDDQNVVVRKGLNRRECFVMDTDDLQLFTVADVGNVEALPVENSGTEIDDGHEGDKLNADSCPSLASFSEGLKQEGISSSPSSSFRSTDKEAKPRSQKAVRILVEDDNLDGWSSAAPLSDFGTEHIERSDSDVDEAQLHYARDDGSAEKKTEQSQFDDQREFSGDSGKPLQVTRMRWRRDKHRRSRQSYSLHEQNEAGILDDDDAEVTLIRYEPTNRSPETQADSGTITVLPAIQHSRWVTLQRNFFARTVSCSN